MRQECLNRWCSSYLEDSRAEIEAWRREYDDERPRMAGDLAPGEVSQDTGQEGRPETAARFA